MWPLEDADFRFQRHNGSGRPRATEDWEDRLIVISTVTAPDSSLSTIRCASRTRRAASPLMMLMKGKERWKAPDHITPRVISLKIGV
ncbi:hypothetical protein TNCV_2844631 [Trichonephila clavipes]|nr:hypothetical protein TNCV_2844631 [Trichonephila clavipes]